MYAADPSTTYVDIEGPFSAPQDAYGVAYLEAVWVNAGGDANAAATAAAIALAESSGVANAVNPSDNGGVQTSWGLWQLSQGDHNAPIANWADATSNAAGAVAKYRAAGNSFAQDWGTYNSGAYLQFMPAANTVASSDPYNAVANGDPNLEDQILNTLTGGAYGEAKSIGSDLQSALSGVNAFFGGLQNLANNPGPLLIGLALLTIGALLLTFAFGERVAGAAEKIAEHVAEAGAVAATAAEVLA